MQCLFSSMLKEKLKTLFLMFISRTIFLFFHFHQACLSFAENDTPYITSIGARHMVCVHLRAGQVLTGLYVSGARTVIKLSACITSLNHHPVRSTSHSAHTHTHTHTQFHLAIGQDSNTQSIQSCLLMLNSKLIHDLEG
ncbi:hypothetical protein XENOCAPTIV_002281 [Xenoophorus captivus]|uniref:Secreted protein n=1 Tax=Xenoophorus captivus TaxID=1517983 RepID=A0ABV0S365_9TELE